MRIGVVFESNSNAHYRAIDPMKAMARRGHEIVWPRDEKGEADLQRLVRCDVVHVYRRAAGETAKVLGELGRRGVPFTYDNDDDFRAVPRESPDYAKVGGLRGQRIFAATAKVARAAHTVTVTNELLAEKYRSAGAERVEVIGNYLSPDLQRPTSRRSGLVVGWVAGIDHRAEVARLNLREAFEDLLDANPDVRVECIGANLGLCSRYRHDEFVPFHELPARIGGFDIGIAPLADIAGNWARSDIKVKEYSASGVPWLASPIGPYLGLGERQGGRLVEPGAWTEALVRLAGSSRERKRLARRAKRWARGQTIDSVADRWERVLATAAESAQDTRRRATTPSRTASLAD